MAEKKTMRVVIAIQVDGEDSVLAHASTASDISGAEIAARPEHTHSELVWLAQRIANGHLCGYDCDSCIDPAEFEEEETDGTAE